MSTEGNNLFGYKEITPEFYVFHDESGNYHCDDWVFTGLLWVSRDKATQVQQYINIIRERYQYLDEIHFNKLPKSFLGDYGKKAKVAKELLELWIRKLSDFTYFNVLAVNRKHFKYDHKRFKKNFHAYNRFTLIALKSGLAWFFKDKSKLNLSIYSDEKSRRPKGILGDGINYDNFEKYIMDRLKEDTKSYKGPEIKLLNPVKCISCNKNGPYSKEEELLQLVDLLLGAVSTAINPRTKRGTKIWLAQEISYLIEDIRKEPWKQTYKLHRKFAISYFPDDQGLIYIDGPIGIVSNKDEDQLKLDIE